MQRFVVFCLAALTASLAASIGHAATRAFEPMDVFALEWVDNPRISPDGQHIVYQRMGFDVMKDRKRSSLWVIDADGRHHRPLAASGSGAAWSPLHYVDKVSTPTMMIVGDDDHRTPASEAEQFYQALKLRKIDTAMVRIPGASHEINARPSNMIAQVLNTIAWFEKHRATTTTGKQNAD